MASFLDSLTRSCAAEKKTNRPMVLVALILAMSLAAIEGTIVATAMPSIAAELGGFSLYGWVFSAYLLTQAVTTPIFGKLADLYGRKPMFIAGIAVFMLGSSLCGFAHSMTALILFRLLQGVGAGGVLPIAVTLAGDLYTIAERGKVQGYVASVWGISSIVGPLLGGLIVHSIGWEWIFWLNLPLGLVSIFIISRCLYENVEHHKRSIDYVGAILLLFGLSGLMLALTQASAWGGLATAGLLALSAVLLFVFVRVEAKVPDPIVHLELFKIPIIRKGNLTIMAAGLAMIGLISFLPTYVQAVQGHSPLVAGFALSAMSLGWPIASVVAGRMLVKQGVRKLVRAGCLAACVGTIWIASLATYGPVVAGVGSFIVGTGFGFLNTTFLVAIQASVDWRQRGVATASNMLMRSIGNSTGAALLGGVLNYFLASKLAAQGLGNSVSIENVRDLVGGTGRHGDPAQLAQLQTGLAQSIHIVFWVIVGFTVLTLLLGWSSPDLHPQSPAAETTEGMQVALDSGLEPPGPEAI